MAFFSKALGVQHSRLSVYNKEMMAIVVVVQKWRPYLIGKHFTIKTDHHSLKYLMEQKISTPSQQKWIAKLLGYDFTIVYKKGKENLVADALSRVAKLYFMIVVIGQFVQQIKDSYKDDSKISKLVQQLQ